MFSALIIVWLLLAILPAVVFLAWRVFWTVPPHFVVVLDGRVYGPGESYCLWPGMEGSEQRWQIVPEQATIDTPRGAFVIGWVPRLDRFLAFISKGGDEAVRGKFCELLGRKTEILTGDFVVDEQSREYVVPEALRRLATEMGVEIRTYFPPVSHRASNVVRANIEDALKSAVFQCTTLLEVKRKREEFFSTHRDEITSHDEKCDSEDRKLSTMIDEFFDNMEQVVRAARLHVDEIDPRRWP